MKEDIKWGWMKNFLYVNLNIKLVVEFQALIILNYQLISNANVYDKWRWDDNDIELNIYRVNF